MNEIESPQGNRRRLLLLTNDFEGGTANHICSLARCWHESGWDAEVVSEDPAAADADLPVPAICLPALDGLDRFPFAQVRRLIQVGKIVAERRPDVVHTYFFWPIMYGRLLKLAGLIPVLVENREDLGFNWGPRQYTMLRSTSSLPDRIVCVSDAIEQHVLEKEGIDEGRTEVIHNGIRMPRQPSDEELSELRDRLGLDAKSPVVTMVANYERPVKGMSDFLDAVPQVLERVPEARFVVVGRGPARYERLADDRGLDSHVVFAGPHPKSAMDGFYALSDVSVLTSHSEGLSLTVLESMSHGLPVVVTRVGGNPEVVLDGETGYLVPPRDPTAFSDRLVSLLRDGEMRRRMGSAARERVRQKFHVESVAHRYLDQYDDLLQGGNVRGVRT